MKLETKLTAICAAILLTTVTLLSGIMLWQIRELADAPYSHLELAALHRRFTLIVLFICAFGVLGANKLIYRALIPLRQLQHSVENVVEGKNYQSATISSKDELGILAENFNLLAASCEKYARSLTEKNDLQKIFIANVTHEFKTPLTSLLLNVQTLRTMYLPEDRQQELLESIDDQLHWLEHMVSKLLKLINLDESAKISLSSVPELLEQVQQLTERTMKKYGTILKVDCTVSMLPMDKELLCYALVSLIENSAQASNPGQTIFIRAAGNTIEVVDEGNGIPEKDLQRVTEPFYICDSSRNKTNAGSGLGMTLVKKIATAHRASLDIQSSSGVGTTVRMKFDSY